MLKDQPNVGNLKVVLNDLYIGIKETNTLKGMKSCNLKLESIMIYFLNIG